MENKDNIYQMFAKRCDNICDAKFIMSSNVINSLLQFMPNFSCIMQLVSSCNQGENYKQLFANASEGNFFKMPKSKKKIICLVTGMLFDIDQTNIDFNSFLIRYFYSEDYELSYQAFCKTVIKNYAEAFKIMLDNFEEDENIAKQDNQLIENRTAVEQILPLIASIKECITSDSKLAQNKRNECQEMLEGLEYVLELGNSKMINVVWIGLKSVFGGMKSVNSFLLAIAEILKMYAIC